MFGKIVELAYKALPFAYSTVLGVSETLDTMQGILVAQAGGNLTKTPTIDDTETPAFGIALSIGVLAGLLEFLTVYCFQGAVIRKNNEEGAEANSPEITDEELEALIVEAAPCTRLSPYIVMKYTYIATGLVVDYLGVSLIYSATKAWIQDFSKPEGEDIPLSMITGGEAGLLLVYYMLFDLPFILTNEMPETCKEIRKLFSIKDHQMPVFDQAFSQKVLQVARPFAGSYFFRRYVRITGSMTDTIEHVLPMLIIVPPSFILKFYNISPFVTLPTAVCASLFILTVTGTILAQTYLFEGNFSENNLKNVANQFGEEIAEEEPWLQPELAKHFHRLLNLGGPLHGIDTALSLLLTLQEQKAHPAMTYTLSAASFLTSWIGNHYSEVKESQHSLNRVTLPKIIAAPDQDPVDLQGSVMLMLYRKKYNISIQTDDENVSYQP